VERLAITKVNTVANMLDVPLWSCHLKKDSKNIVVVDNGQEYLAFSEKRSGNGFNLNLAVRKWYRKNAWRFPISLLLKYSENSHHGFDGIKNENLINELERIKEKLGEDFNELALTIVQNKTQFIKDIIRDYGYKYMFQPIDDKEVIANGFRIYRIK
jgi:hypothetical protein